ncbi:MAG: ABC transporter permease [Armatimonadetes bacterium]|nr:ABC transporter permease [Armatimonadota bacterium]
MRALAERVTKVPQFGLAVVILLLTIVIASRAGSHVDRVSGATVNSFLNPSTLVQVLTDTSFFAILGTGIAMVILTGGIDLSVGSTYALSGVLTAMALRSLHAEQWPGPQALAVAVLLCLGIGVACGLLNGLMVTNLGVHPFVITLGTMWIFRGLAFVTSKAESILVPQQVTDLVKVNLFLRKDLYPVPFLVMALAVTLAAVYLAKTVAGRNIYAVGGSSEASHYAGIRVPRVLIGVYTLCGLAAGLAAFLGASYFGAASCSDGQGYELYAIASAVVGGVSLNGGRGTVLGAALGALLIVLFRQAVVTLHLDTKYEWVIIGLAIIVAVFLDRLARRRYGSGE